MLVSIESKFFSLGLAAGEERKGRESRCIHESKFSCLGRSVAAIIPTSKNIDEMLRKIDGSRNVITSGSVYRAHRPNSFRASAYDVRKKNRRKIITIISIRASTRRGTFRELNDNEHERRSPAYTPPFVNRV